MKEPEICPSCGRTRDGAAGRVRELEAELAEERKAAEYGRMRLGPNLRKMVDDQKARAEKAEKTSAEWQAVAEQRTEAWQKAEAVSRPEECPWRETDLGCPCEVPGLDNDGVRDKAIIDAADALKKAEARVAELADLLMEQGDELDKWRARIAELEDDPVKWGEQIALKAAREAREREDLG